MASVPTEPVARHVACALAVTAFAIAMATDAVAAGVASVNERMTVQMIDSTPVPADGNGGALPTPDGAPAPDDARPDAGNVAPDGETGRTEQPWGLPAPGCPYEEGPLDLIV